MPIEKLGNNVKVRITQNVNELIHSFGEHNKTRLNRIEVKYSSEIKEFLKQFDASKIEIIPNDVAVFSPPPKNGMVKIINKVKSFFNSLKPQKPSVPVKNKVPVTTEEIITIDRSGYFSVGIESDFAVNEKLYKGTKESVGRVDGYTLIREPGRLGKIIVKPNSYEDIDLLHALSMSRHSWNKPLLVESILSNSNATRNTRAEIAFTPSAQKHLSELSEEKLEKLNASIQEPFLVPLGVTKLVINYEKKPKWTHWTIIGITKSGKSDPKMFSPSFFEKSVMDVHDDLCNKGLSTKGCLFKKNEIINIF